MIRFMKLVRNPATQKKLLSMKKLTFTDACEVARSLEAAEANSKEISNNLSKEATPASAVAPVHFVEKTAWTEISEKGVVLPLW